MKGYQNPRWHLVTTIDLRSKSCMCCTKEICITRTLPQIYLYKSSTITKSLGKVWLEILVANLATNFQDLVTKEKNLVTSAPVLGTILRPVLRICYNITSCKVECFHIKHYKNTFTFLFFLPLWTSLSRMSSNTCLCTLVGKSWTSTL